MRLKWLSLLFIPFAAVLLMSHNSFASSETIYVEKTQYSGLTSWRSYVGGAELGNQAESLTNYSQSGNYPFYLLSTQSAWYRYLWDFRNNYTVANPDNYTGAVVTVNDILQYRSVSTTSMWSDQQYAHSVIMTFTDNTTETYNCYTGNGDINFNVSQGNGYYNAQCTFTAQKPLKSFVHRVGNTSFSSSNSIVKMGAGQGNGVYAYRGFYEGEFYKGEVPAVIPQLDDISGQIDDLSDDINNHYNQENDAVDNISNQQPPASGSAENATTSSLLQTLQSFVTALQGISATNCDVTLAFPSFAGGSMVVNPCQNKEFAGNIISIGGSLLLVSFYIPVAYMLIRKIYSEIRSFTNG